MDGDLEDARHLIGDRNEFTVVTALSKEILRMRLLKIAAADLGRWDVRGDSEHGDS